VRRAAGVAAALTLLAAATPAFAFRRSEARNEDGSPIPGRCTWWRTNQIPVVFNPELANTRGCAPGAALQLARATLATWSTATRGNEAASCTDVQLVDGGTTPRRIAGYDGTNLIVWRRGVCSDPAVVSSTDACHQCDAAPDEDPCHARGQGCADTYGCWDHGTAGTIAITTTTFSVGTGEILDADMELFEHDDNVTGRGFWFTCAGEGAPTCVNAAFPTTSCVSMDLGSTVAHETGHMLGLAHNCETALGCADRFATMFASAAIGDTHKRDLAEDDVAGVCTMYPAGAPPSPSGGNGASGTACQPLATGNSSGGNGGGGGCTSAGPGAAAGPASAAAFLVLLGVARLARGRPRLSS
jgi:hypothetical protein